MTRIGDDPKIAPAPLPLEPTPTERSAPRQAAGLGTVQTPIAQAQAQASIEPSALRLAPPQPASTRLAGAPLEGARSFAGQLMSLGAPPLDSDNLVAQFLHLQILDASASDVAQNLLFAARGALMRAAFTQERAMRPLLNEIDNMRAQATDLEERAEKAADRGMFMLNPMDGLMALMLKSDDIHVGGGVNMGKLNDDLWYAAYDSLVAAIVDAAVESNAAAAGGDGAGDHRDLALERGGRAAEILGGLGFPTDEMTVRALVDLAKESLAEGKDGTDVFSRYYASHPEALAGLVSGSDAERIQRQGPTREDMLAIIEAQRRTHRTPDDDPSRYDAIQYIDETIGLQLIERYEQKYPEAVARAKPAFERAFDLYGQAMDLRARINAILSGYNDLLHTISQARSAENTHGVLDRGASRELQILHSIDAVLNGSSAEKARDARVDLQQHRAEVARLTLAVIDRHAAMSNEKSHGGRI